jgi:hypothetical protein
VAGIVVTIAGFVVVAWTASDMQERADQGEIVYEHRGSRTLFGMLVVPVLIGGVAFLAVFKATGGKLPAEYERGLRG